MMKSVQLTRNNSGFILISMVIMFAFLGVLGTTLIEYLTYRQENLGLEIDRLQAFYLAEAAISHAIYELKSDSDEDNNGLGNVEARYLGGGTYSAEHNFQVLTITGTGEYNDIERKVQIKYSIL